MTTALQASAQETLRRLIEQIERLESEKKDLSDDIRDKVAEAKAQGFDAKAIRTVLRMRKKSKVDREEEEAMVTLYLGCLEGTPLGDWASDKQQAAH